MSDGAPPPTGETVHVLTWRLLDFEGLVPTYGGQQRWLLELCALLRASGHAVIVHQRSTRPFERELRDGVVVRGHPAAPRATATPRWNLAVHRTIPADAPVVYMVEDLAFPICRRRSLVVQHGIWWDGEYGWLRVRMAERIARHAVRRSGGVVCVDTNFVNWYRARFSRSQDDGRLHVVPNFVDPAQWGPPPSRPAADVPAGAALTVCFPRRSEPRRGMHLLAEVMPSLAARFPELRFRLTVGSGYHTDALRRRLAAAAVPADRWWIESLPFERMREAYQHSAIVLVPTLCGEGTSLSAIEAQYFGCAVVATWVGGLPNVIHDGFDGLLVPPTAAAVEGAIARLVDDGELRVALGRNAQHTVLARFGIERWRDGVRTALTTALGVCAR